MPIEILIVDDSAVMRSMISRVLQMVGRPLGAIHEAGDGGEGLEVLAQQSVDLVLVDINMPGMGGEEMIERMRSDPELAELPIIVISTEASETRIKSLAERDVRFIHKPFTPESIRDVLDEVLEKKYDSIAD